MFEEGTAFGIIISWEVMFNTNIYSGSSLLLQYVVLSASIRYMQQEHRGQICPNIVRWSSCKSSLLVEQMTESRKKMKVVKNN
ncbi:hypothetical protein GDO81_011970 [Engystomops pustulosus]|uniref:Uncharacterized protein n=1 Tax=Engystomops pustulosus TaxID=76066 RepID=A0AAV7BIC5_ENGPU|nr:hypothetical protein GDO81_011970 [Engystomops pustulosus]